MPNEKKPIGKSPEQTLSARLRAALSDQTDAIGIAQRADADDMASLVELGTGSSEIRDVLTDADWVRSSGKTPLEFLSAVYRHPLIKMTERINAAKAVLDYSHRKMPTELELSGGANAIKLSADMVSGLTDAELDTLEALMTKACKAAAAREGGA